MLIQIHMLQNYAPANLNRDDTGSPKDAIFGGKRRGRISSQCLKRSVRRSEAFQQAFGPAGLLGLRTKALPQLIEEELRKLDADDEALTAIVTRIPEIGRESKKKKAEEDEEQDTAADTEASSETKQLIFIGRDELPVMAGKLLEIYRQLGPRDWKKAKIDDITTRLGGSVPCSVDIAMFGRMTTSSAFRDVEAAVQVAHAISTNILAAEFDYYTAVDDLTQESRARMIGDIEFNSSTYYKYANIHWQTLLDNLGGDVGVSSAAVLAFLEAFATAQPSGKQNSFAAFSLPDLILVEVSNRNLPVSYANAFLKPAHAASDHTLMDDSIQLLVDYLTRVSQAYGFNPQRAYISLSLAQLPNAMNLASLSDLQKWLSGQLPVEG